MFEIVERLTSTGFIETIYGGYKTEKEAKREADNLRKIDGFSYEIRKEVVRQ